MKRVRLGVLLTLALSACSPVEEFDVALLLNGHVKIALPSGMKTCIQKLSIIGEGGTVWIIDGYSSQVCIKSVEFPQLPPGFKAKVPARPLKPGRYSIDGKAGAYYMSGELSVPAR